jgi:hypothetical protein
MSEFKRGVSKEFIQTLNEFRKDENSFWSKMLNDKELFIAIRDKYLNVYYYGQSICKLFSNKEHIKGETHKKYLGVNDVDYFTSEDGEIKDPTAIIKSLCAIDEIKKNVKKHIGEEKRASYNQILSEPDKCIDVEVTLVENKVELPTKLEDYKRNSIDFAVVENEQLVFYEAKHISNQEIRSNSPKPDVIYQLERYKESLENHKDEIISSYQIVSKNREDLGITSSSIKKLSINTEPRLIIFETSENDKHIQKLKNILEDRLILRSTNRKQYE